MNVYESPPAASRLLGLASSFWRGKTTKMMVWNTIEEDFSVLGAACEILVREWTRIYMIFASARE